MELASLNCGALSFLGGKNMITKTDRLILVIIGIPVVSWCLFFLSNLWLVTAGLFGFVDFELYRDILNIWEVGSIVGIAIAVLIAGLVRIRELMEVL